MNIKEIFFSQEELLYLLRALNLPDLPGMGMQPWGHIPQEQVLLVMETAGRGLVARGIARFGNMQMEIDDDTATLLDACAYPRQMLTLTYDHNGTAIHQNFFRGKQFDIAHTLPYPWVHFFEVKKKKKTDMGLGLLQSLVENVPDNEKTSAVFLLQQSLLDEIRNLTVHDSASAIQQLIGAGLTEPLAQKFTNTLRAPKVKILLQAVYDFGEKVRQNVFSILADDDSCWLVSAGEPGNETVQVIQVDRKKLNEIIHATFASFI